MILLVSIFFQIQNSFTNINTLLVDNAKVFASQIQLNDSDNRKSQNILCSENPMKVKIILDYGKKLGVNVEKGIPKLPGKDATYEAFYGKIGTVIVKDRPMTNVVYCKLIVHEFIHVLQHLKADLKAVTPLGWDVDSSFISRYGSLQEAEAYQYQNNLGKVLSELNKFKN